MRHSCVTDASPALQYPKQREDFDTDDEMTTMILECVRDRMAKVNVRTSRYL